MRITRFISEELVKLDMDTVRDPELEEQFEHHDQRLVVQYRERIIGEAVELLEESGKIGNKQKLYIDLLNREKRACTAIGQSFAIPHVRTMQAKDTVMGFLRSRQGLPFGAPDGLDVHIFLPIIGPPYNDKIYLKIYRRIGELLLEEGILDRFMEVDQPGEVIRILGNIS
jgi:mannitol/fructose-specific phosphotransferase system IIA component (Ntr-type)